MRLASIALASLFVCTCLAGTKPEVAGGSPVENLQPKKLTPRPVPPKNIDWLRIQNAYAFLKKHNQTIQTTLVTTSLVSTYACKDIEPVLMYTEELAKNYDDRMAKTGQWVGEIQQPPATEAEFRKKNYARAFDLGQFHLDLSKSIPAKDLGWDPKERVAMNQQAYAFVLYSFAWQPIETMEAIHEIDATKDAKDIDDWFYLWHVLGYAMGLEEWVLPRNATQAKNLAQDLRRVQYFPEGKTPKDVDLLMKNEMKYLYAQFIPAPKPEEKAKAGVRQILAQFISFSPGLGEALGLGKNPAKRLEELSADSPNN